jgi:hypothetical protein
VEGLLVHIFALKTVVTLMRNMISSCALRIAAKGQLRGFTTQLSAIEVRICRSQTLFVSLQTRLTSRRVPFGLWSSTRKTFGNQHGARSLRGLVRRRTRIEWLRLSGTAFSRKSKTS